MTTKKAITLIFLLVLSTGIYAQTSDDYIEVMRSVLKTEKKAAIAEAMELTESESEPFWSLYNEYNEKMYIVQNNRIKAIKEFSDNFESLSDEKADEIWNLMLQFKTESAKLEKSYYKKFKKILPAAKAVKYFQAENKIEALVSAKIAMEIPMIEQK
ncbi:MAG: hypothetical protein L3J34_03410 [Flavobacteriaceae bacterium]|nr:hypothetical protein [Flavobacteriaceae bacterium]